MKLRKAEFARRLGITIQNLNTYIKRGKVVVSSDGLINDMNNVNKMFIEKRLINNEKNKYKEGEYYQKGDTGNGTDFCNYTKEKIKLECARLEEQIVLERIKKEKALGVVIPTELVRILFATTFKEMTDSYYRATEDIASMVVHKMGGGREDIIFFRNKLIEKINQFVAEGKKNTEKSIKNIVYEYQEIRSSGEKK